MDAGEKIFDCVCGAPNVRVGMKTAFATVGGMVGGMKIEARPVAGVMSQGMCCSEQELGISADNSGIMDINRRYRAWHRHQKGIRRGRHNL